MIRVQDMVIGVSFRARHASPTCFSKVVRACFGAKLSRGRVDFEIGLASHARPATDIKRNMRKKAGTLKLLWHFGTGVETIKLEGQKNE